MSQFVYTMHAVGKVVPPKREILKDISLLLLDSLSSSLKSTAQRESPEINSPKSVLFPRNLVYLALKILKELPSRQYQDHTVVSE